MIERLRGQIPAGAAGEFSSPESVLCADLFDARSTPVLPRWYVKDPGHSAKSAGGRLHLNTHTPLARFGSPCPYFLMGLDVHNNLLRMIMDGVFPVLQQL